MEEDMNLVETAIGLARECERRKIQNESDAKRIAALEAENATLKAQNEQIKASELTKENSDQ